MWNVTDDHQLVYDLENTIRIRVEEVKFREERNFAAVASRRGKDGGDSSKANGNATTPQKTPPQKAPPKTAQSAQPQEPPPTTAPPPAPPQDPAMSIIAGVDQSGLGITTWWPADDLDAET